MPNGGVNVSEAAGTGTSLSDYTSAYNCVYVSEGSQDEPVSGEGTSLSGLDVTSGDNGDRTSRTRVSGVM